MSPDLIFQICSTVAMCSWVVLIFISPFWPKYDKFLIGIIITLFAVVYTWLIFSSINLNDLKGFGSLNGVMTLFQNRTLVTAGWLHYLAFDLMTGIWIQKNAKRHHIHYWLTAPCLFLTFMLGPFGLLLYLMLRWLKTKEFLAANF
ncbi:MAG: ABA4-like family protein [Ginsengibacter sp.]